MNDHASRNGALRSTGQNAHWLSLGANKRAADRPFYDALLRIRDRLSIVYQNIAILQSWVVSPNHRDDFGRIGHHRSMNTSWMSCGALSIPKDAIWRLTNVTVTAIASLDLTGVRPGIALGSDLCSWQTHAGERQSVAGTLPVTPAMVAGITDHIWTTIELLSYTDLDNH
jgi:hypothetical protein